MIARQPEINLDLPVHGADAEAPGSETARGHLQILVFLQAHDLDAASIFVADHEQAFRKFVQDANLMPDAKKVLITHRKTGATPLALAPADTHPRPGSRVPIEQGRFRLLPQLRDIEALRPQTGFLDFAAALLHVTELAQQCRDAGRIHVEPHLILLAVVRPRMLCLPNGHAAFAERDPEIDRALHRPLRGRGLVFRVDKAWERPERKDERDTSQGAKLHQIHGFTPHRAVEDAGRTQWNARRPHRPGLPW